jgi:hypothetical protein
MNSPPAITKYIAFLWRLHVWGSHLTDAGYAIPKSQWGATCNPEADVWQQELEGLATAAASWDGPHWPAWIPRDVWAERVANSRNAAESLVAICRADESVNYDAVNALGRATQELERIAPAFVE